MSLPYKVTIALFHSDKRLLIVRSGMLQRLRRRGGTLGRPPCWRKIQSGTSNTGLSGYFLRYMGVPCVRSYVNTVGSSSYNYIQIANDLVICLATFTRTKAGGPVSLPYKVTIALFHSDKRLLIVRSGMLQRLRRRGGTPAISCAVREALAPAVRARFNRPPCWRKYNQAHPIPACQAFSSGQCGMILFLSP